MIVVDFNSFFFRIVAVELAKDEISGKMLMGFLLKSLANHFAKLKPYREEVVIAFDHRNYWRREVFEYYKVDRKKKKAASKIDWEQVYKFVEKARQILPKYLPYKFLYVNGAEADDICAVLAKKLVDRDVVLVSTDSDFVQLLKYRHVQLYNPKDFEFVVNDDPDGFLFEKLMRGDRKDCIPNVLSPDDIFTKPERQKPVTQKKLAEYRESESFCDDFPELCKAYKRNRLLIDFDYIPVDVVNSIFEAYQNCSPVNSKPIRKLFIDLGVGHIVESAENLKLVNHAIV